jgi:sugar phosphate isomerase/epimerase
MRIIVSHSQLSVQLYTVREAIAEDLAGTIARIAQIGFTQVEPYNFAELPGLGEALQRSGLSAPTGHAHYLGESEAEQREVFAAAQQLGIGRAIDPHVEAARWQTAYDIDETAAQLNAAALIADEFGVSVGYHNHAHELQTDIDGITALEYFAGRLDPVVGLEVDTYWAVVGGQDPVALLKRLGDRVVALHIKDGPGTSDTKDQVAVGAGSLPIRAIAEAAPHALRIVELDDSNGDRFQAVADSYAFLVKENLA